MNAVKKVRVAIVTGGTQGIGLSIARRFVQDGWRVVVTARNAERLNQVVKGLGPLAIAVQGDIGSVADVERLAATVSEHFGTFDVLVNNAGVAQSLPIGAPLVDAAMVFDRVMNTNVRGAVLAVYALVPLLRTPGGRIINIGSIIAHNGGSAPGLSAYVASKGAIHGLTLALARELGPRGINVFTVAPGYIAETGQSSGLGPARVAQVVGQIPLGRPGKGEDVASAVAWLASPESSYITGMTLPVNGGWQFYQ